MANENIHKLVAERVVSPVNSIEHMNFRLLLVSMQNVWGHVDMNYYLEEVCVLFDNTSIDLPVSKMLLVSIFLDRSLVWSSRTLQFMSRLSPIGRLEIIYIVYSSPPFCCKPRLNNHGGLRLRHHPVPMFSFKSRTLEAECRNSTRGPIR